MVTSRRIAKAIRKGIEFRETKWTYKKERGYQPLPGFISEIRLVIANEFRDSNIPAGAGALDSLKYCEDVVSED